VTAEEEYVAAAYLVVFLFLLVYVVIMAAKLSRLGREVSELAALARKRRGSDGRVSETEREEVEVG
jgi:CcmD family protein